LKIHNLSLVYFKNHTDLNWEINADIIGIGGLNGIGKTNVLDALYYVCTGKSYFAATDIQCIQNGEEAAGILATLENSDSFNIKIKFKKGGKKRIQKNGVLQTKIADYLGTFYAVVIAPGDIALIYGANEVRRSFVNQILSQTDKLYLENLLKYNKLIEHRNRHLKQDNIDNDLLNVIDAQISPFATEIYKSRASFLAEFVPVFQEKYAQLAENRETVSFVYTSQLSADSYINLAQKSRKKDVIVQRSFVGIHKDELEINLNDFSLKKYGSQGQIKSALIALKLAEYAYVHNRLGFLPLLLLDDIFEKIDDKRASMLTQLIKKGNFGQVFLTDTNTERIEAFCQAIEKKHQIIALE
jgi:DNA replication and repair protein RecF